MNHDKQDVLNYTDPTNVICRFTYEELEEISESLLYTRINDPNVDRDYSVGLRKKVQRIIKLVRQRNPDLKTT